MGAPIVFRSLDTTLATIFGSNGVRWIRRGSDGYWVAVGQAGKMAYATGPNGPWTDISSNGGFSTSAINCVDFDGTYWVAVSDGGKIRYASTPPTGAWSAAAAPGFGASNVFEVRYGGGKWVAVGGVTGGVKQTTDPTGTWSSPTSITLTAPFTASVDFDGTYWALCAPSGAIRYATDPAGTWSAATTGNSITFYSIAYGGGWWVAGGLQSGTGYVMVKQTDPTGTWTNNSTNAGFTQSGNTYVTGLCYGEGYWLGASTNLTNNIARYAADPSGTWTAATIPATSTATDTVRTSYGAGFWIVSGKSASTGWLVNAPFLIPPIKTVNRAVQRASVW